ncbi:AraC family transcriptional regulator [Malaciobacter mytili]|uniref:AraC family transcriptional regulator n=1 Tax=Malaciobacter mytili TaxID=603050 RepID=UPI00100A9217|nr:GyrI-like domain-containing protein [Malaciobacter mytili]RXI47077.1 AraC family transcriptional regulator [Malaciobacter mytili]
MKKDTKQQRANIVNKTLFYIYKNIDTNISLEELAKLNSVSKYHFHRIFKEETKQNLFDFITSIRLQKAANLLITNQYSTISEIANMCGYSSHSSFIKAFKQKFSYTPTAWRKSGHKEYSKNLIGEHRRFDKIDIKIEVSKERFCAYIRHKGYDKSISKTWQKLKALAYEYNLKEYKEIALHHDNPTITPLSECNYVAAIEVPKDFKSNISTLEIPKTLCAVFKLKGVYGDVLAFLRYVYHYWLPSSGYEATTLPSYVIYHKNHFLNEDNQFDLTFYLPVKVIY